jgi:isopenicillin N synthase-like dioxygenase
MSIRKVPELNLYDYLLEEANEEAKGKKSEFSKSLFEGLKDYGFIVLTGHPISTELLDRSYELSKKLFAMSEEQKKSYSIPENGHQRGYTPFGVEHAKDSKVADLKEFWHVGREGLDELKNFWPSELPDFKETFVELYGLLDQVGLALLEALTSELDLPTNYFYTRVSRGNSILRLLHYPPIPEGVEKGALRAAPHEDINLITILVAATQSGLQLKDRDGTWLDVEPPKNSLIVDAGDMLSRITNEVIPATTHQVINPNASNEDRYSMPFFMHPNSDAVLECIPSCIGKGVKYPPITSDKFLKERLREIGL